jgi:protoporphyrinogen oxidase
MKVGICGGGVAGVSLARFLDRRHQITILEAEPDAGGLARSFPFRGFSYDVGPHIIFSRNQVVLQDMLALADGELSHPSDGGAPVARRRSAGRACWSSKREWARQRGR